MPKHVTTREIARILNLDHSTVSLGLRNSPLLKAETIERIQTAAQKLGYRPDPMLKALSSYRLSKRPASFHAVIAWINNWKNREKLLSNPVYSAYFNGACVRAQKLGFTVQEFALAERGMTPQKLQSVLRARNIQGLLLPPQSDTRFPLEIDFTDFYAVAFGYSMQPRTLHLVTNHHAQTIDLIMSKLVELGYRRPAYCIPRSSDIGNNYIWLTRALYLTPRYPELAQLPRPPEEKKIFLKWLRTHKPDVLVGFNDHLETIESWGLKVPADIGYASLAVVPSNRRISGANENDFLIGETAVNILVGMINHQERGLPAVPIRTLVDSAWFEGETLRRQK